MSEPPVVADDADEPEAEYPPLLPTDADDPLGLGFAAQIANQVAGTQAPRGLPRRRPRRPRAIATRSGAGPDGRDPQTLGDLLGRVVRDQDWTIQVGVRQLLLSWPALVGQAIADHSEPTGYADGVVQVQADSTAWATALRQLAPQLVAKLNERLGDGTVTRIDVRGPNAPTWKHGIRSVRDGRGPRDTYG